MTMNWDQINWLGFNWSQWIPLESSIQVYQNYITKNPGLYRIWITHNSKLAYIGQTGRNLRERTRQLASKVNNNHDNPPWNDPHTAAPALWSWKTENDLFIVNGKLNQLKDTVQGTKGSKQSKQNDQALKQAEAKLMITTVQPAF